MGWLRSPAALVLLPLGITVSLTLSAFWTRIRSGLVRQLPGEWQARLPVAGAMAAA